MKIFDLHCDTIGECYKQGKSLLKNDLHLDITRCSEYDSYTQVFAIWIPDEYRDKTAVDYFDNVSDLFYRELQEHSDSISLYSEDKNTPVKAVLSVEGASACAGALEGLERLYNKGVRLITLTWNGNNEIAGGAFSTGGVTPFGETFINRCEELGIVIDVSHLNRESFWEFARLSTKPFVASHSNADIVDNYYAHHRNLTKEQIEFIKERHGLIGLNFCQDFIETNQYTGVDALKNQIDYFVSLGCEKIIALGSDYDGCEIHGDLCGVEKLRNVYNRLLESGYDQSLIDDIFFYNAQNFFT